MVDELTENSSAGARSNRVVTVPNAICALRLLGCPVLVGLAVAGRNDAFLWLFVALAMSDWLDGKLAILLNQRSVLGARLDSWADAALYIALLFGALWLHGETLRGEIAWLLPPVITYGLSTMAGFWKFKCWPSYHTRAAKTSWLLILVGVVALFTGWSLWPLRVALAGISLTNLEAILITIVSPTWRADVTSIYHAWRDRTLP